MRRLADIVVEDALLEDACAGREPAQRALYEALAPATVSLIRRLVGHRALAEDVFQDTMMTSFQRLPQFRREAPLGAWLRRIAVSRCLMYLRSPWQRARLCLEPVDCGVAAEVAAPITPAAEAGIRAGDVIVAVNGTELKGGDPARQLMRLLRDIEPDSRVSLRVLREGRTREFTVIARPAPMAVVTAHGLPDMDFGPVQIRGGFMLHGALRDTELATLTPRLGSYFGSDKGVLVVRAPADGALKLEDGDVILAIDGREPASGSHATRILGSYQPGEKISLRILRQHKTLELQATVPGGGRGHLPADTDFDKDVLYLEKDALRLDGDAQRRDSHLQRLEPGLQGPLPPRVLIVGGDAI